jgi:hypothetical protein
MADILNDFFVSVFTKEDMNNMPVVEQEEVHEMGQIIITAEMIRKKIKELGTRLCTGT